MPSNRSPINGFNGKYRFLSNFWECPNGVSVQLKEDGCGIHMRASTSEHVYQAAKVEPTGTGLSVRAAVLSAITPSAAKRYGGNAVLRDGWDDMRLSVMEQITFAKYEQNPTLRDLLLATDDAYLEETNYWGDKFWGVCKGFGENHLGKILMKVRYELRKGG